MRDALLLVYANKMDLLHALSGDGAGKLRAERQKMASAAGQRSVCGWSNGRIRLGQSNAQDREKVKKKRVLESSSPSCHSSNV